VAWCNGTGGEVGMRQQVGGPWPWADCTATAVYDSDVTPNGVHTGRAGILLQSGQRLADFRGLAFDGSATYAIFELWFRLVTPNGSSGQADSLTVRMGGVGAGGVHWIIRVSTTAFVADTVYLRRSNSATNVDSKVLPLVGWHKFAFKIQISAGAGQYDIEWFYGNDSTALASEGSFTAGAVNQCMEDFELVALGKPTKGQALMWGIDDVAMMDSSGSILNSELATSFGYVPWQPDSDITTGWGNDGGSEAHEFRRVDNFNSDDGADPAVDNWLTLASGVTGTEEFGFPDMTVGETPLMVIAHACSRLAIGGEPDLVRHQVAGESAYEQPWDIDGEDPTGGGVFELSTKYLRTTGDGNPWTEARFNAFRAGFKKDTTGVAQQVDNFGLEVFGDNLTAPARTVEYVPPASAGSAPPVIAQVI